MDAVIDSTFSILAVLGAVGIKNAYGAHWERIRLQGEHYLLYTLIMTPKVHPDSVNANYE